MKKAVVIIICFLEILLEKISTVASDTAELVRNFIKVQIAHSDSAELVRNFIQDSEQRIDKSRELVQVAEFYILSNSTISPISSSLAGIAIAILSGLIFLECHKALLKNPRKTLRKYRVVKLITKKAKNLKLRFFNALSALASMYSWYPLLAPKAGNDHHVMFGSSSHLAGCCKGRNLKKSQKYLHYLGHYRAY